MNTNISDNTTCSFAALVAETTGLHFPRSRWEDLRRGLVAIAKSLQMADVGEAIGWLTREASSQERTNAIANHLTVGETYFFRECRALDVFATDILPALVRARTQGTRHLRIWSVGCCTGEEPYSIAIQLRRFLPDWRDWNITLLATDLNPNFLRKAERGIFGEWSFREAPPWLKPQFFRTRSAGQFEILPEIRQMVRFEQLNLAEDSYPSPVNGTIAMDVVFCRNVLMYFTARGAQRVIESLHRAQSDGGWLIVSPTELLHVSHSSYRVVNRGGAILCRKESERSIAPALLHEDAALAPQCVRQESKPLTLPPRIHAETPAGEKGTSSIALCQAAREMANQGKLEDALRCCEQAIAADKLDARSHYLHGVIFQELDSLDDAMKSLRNALFLDPRFALAHLALGTIAQRRGSSVEARKCFVNALHLLQQQIPDELLAESEGMTAGRLAEIVVSLLSEEAMA